MTCWHKYLEGHSLSSTAQLIEPPRPEEQSLSLLLKAFKSIISTARQSIMDDRINVFD
jgi:hypothetical protein